MCIDFFKDMRSSCYLYANEKNKTKATANPRVRHSSAAGRPVGWDPGWFLGDGFATVTEDKIVRYRIIILYSIIHAHLFSFFLGGGVCV
jgi:hypothetical protein